MGSLRESYRYHQVSMFQGHCLCSRRLSLIAFSKWDGAASRRPRYPRFDFHCGNIGARYRGELAPGRFLFQLVPARSFRGIRGRPGGERDGPRGEYKDERRGRAT